MWILICAQCNVSLGQNVTHYFPALQQACLAAARQNITTSSTFDKMPENIPESGKDGETTQKGRLAKPVQNQLSN